MARRIQPVTPVHSNARLNRFLLVLAEARDAEAFPRPHSVGSGPEGEAESFAEQATEREYSLLVGPNDLPAIHLHKERMDAFREAMRRSYSDPEKYDTYLEPLGIEYPMVRRRH